MSCEDCKRNVTQYDSVRVQNKFRYNKDGKFASQVFWQPKKIKNMKTLCVECAEFWCRAGKDYNSQCNQAKERAFDAITLSQAGMVYPGAKKIQEERERKKWDRLLPKAPSFAPKKANEVVTHDISYPNEMSFTTLTGGGDMAPRNRGNCYASMDEKWLRTNKWLPKGWKSKDVKLPKAGAGLGGGAGAEQRVPGLRKLYYKERQDSWPEWKLEDLPKGWKAVPSKTRPGKLTFVNKLTGERIAYYPTLKASHKPNNLPAYMPRRKFECVKDRYETGDGGGIWHGDTCYYSQKPIAPAKKYLPPIFLTDINTYCEQVGSSKKCGKSSYRHINQAIFGHVHPEGISTAKYPCKWKDDEEFGNFLSSGSESVKSQKKQVKRGKVFAPPSSKDVVFPMLPEDILTGIGSFSDCKTLLKSLTKKRARNYPWKFINSKFTPVGYPVGLPNYERVENPKICQGNKDCIEYYNKCLWLHELNSEIAKGNAYNILRRFKKLKANKMLVLAAVKQDGHTLRYASDEPKADREIVLAAVKQNGFALQFASDELKADKEIVLAAVKNNGNALRYAADELKADKEFVLAAVKKNRFSLRFASDELKADREIVLAAVKKNRFSLRFASDELKEDREFMLAAVKQDGRALEDASDELKADREIVLAAVKQNGRALQFAANKIKADREIVLAAVKQKGTALQDASDELKKDREIVRASRGGSVKGFAPKKATVLRVLLDDILTEIGSFSDCKTLLNSLTKKQARNYPWKFINSKFTPVGYPFGLPNYERVENPKICQGNKDCIEYYNKCLWLHELNSEIAKGNAYNILSRFKKLAANKMLVLAAVAQDGEAIYYAADELKTDREIVLAAVAQDGNSLEYAADELKADREIVLAAVKQDGRALEYASDELKEDREIVLAAVKQTGWTLHHAADELKADREIVLAAVKQDADFFVVAADELKADREFILAAVKQNGDVLQYASDELKADREIVVAARSGSVKEFAPKKATVRPMLPEDILTGIGSFSDCKTLLKSLTKKRARNYPWKFINSKFTPVGYPVGLPNYERVENPKICQGNKDCIEYYNKCLWLHELNSEIAKGNAYNILRRFKKLKANKMLVLAAVKQNGLSLEYASDELKANREIVLAAVNQYARSLEYASDELKADREFILAAVEENGDALRYSADELKADREIVLAAVKQRGDTLRNVLDEFKADREIVLAAVRQDGWALVYASDELKADREIVLAAVKQDGYALEYASDELKKDKEILLAASK